MATPPSWTSSIHPEHHPSILNGIHPSWTYIHPKLSCSQSPGAGAHLPAVMLSSLPMARLHTRPLTLGGSPCHHSSLTRRVPFLHTNPHTKINTHAAIVMGQRDDCRHTWHPNEAISRCSRSPWHWRCCPHVGVAPSSDASSSELLSSLKRCRRTGWCLEHNQNLWEELCLTSPLGSCHHLLILHLVSQSFLHRFGRQVPKGTHRKSVVVMPFPLSKHSTTHAGRSSRMRAVVDRGSNSRFLLLPAAVRMTVGHEETPTSFPITWSSSCGH